MTSPALPPRKAQPAGKVPPLATGPGPGVKGTPPLPVGQLLQKTQAGMAPVRLTDLERKMLASAGIVYQPGMRLPSNMAQIFHQAREQLQLVQQQAHEDATVNLPLPVDPSTPPLEVRTVPIEQLPPEQRDYYASAVQSMMRAELEREEQARSQQQEANRLARLPQSVQQAAVQASQAAAASQTQQQHAMPPQRQRLQTRQDLHTPPPDVVDDLTAYEQVASQLPPVVPAARPRPIDPVRRQLAEQAEALQPGLGAQFISGSAPPAPPPEPGLPPVPPVPPVSLAPPEAGGAAPLQGEDTTTGGDQAMTHCPHCQFPLDQEDIPEPDYGSKMAFLQSVLGQKAFTKSYALLGGHLEVTFRTLTTQEMDEVFRQAYAERVSNQVTTLADFWERINRLRLCLQLTNLRSDNFQHDLPDGLSHETNPYAAAVWSATTIIPEQLSPDETMLPPLESWVFGNVLPTEHLTRMVTLSCNQFNRLVSKMEALVDNSDFWKATGEQS